MDISINDINIQEGYLINSSTLVYKWKPKEPIHEVRYYSLEEDSSIDEFSDTEKQFSSTDKTDKDILTVQRSISVNSITSPRMVPLQRVMSMNSV